MQLLPEIVAVQKYQYPLNFKIKVNPHLSEFVQIEVGFVFQFPAIT